MPRKCIISEETLVKAKEKRKQTCLKKYGVTNVSKLDDVKEKLSKKQKGIKYSKVTKLKISTALKNKPKSEEHKKSISEALTGKPSPIKGRNLSQEHRMKISKSRTMRCLIKDLGETHSKKGLYFSHKNNIYYRYDSSYELKAFSLLETDVSVLSYKRCDFYIPYKLDIIKNYIPDLIVNYINGISKLIEIKPKYKLKCDRLKLRAKFKAAVIYCKLNNLKFEVWTERHLNIGG